MKEYHRNFAGRPHFIKSLKDFARGSKSLTKSKAFLALLTLLFFGNINAQTTLISPTGDGGFENGNTFALNGWSVDSPAPASNKNQWFCGGDPLGPTPGFTGTNCAYVTNNTLATPPPHAYTTTLTSFSHIWRDVTISNAAETSITLDFSWIGNGSANGSLRVYLAPTTFIPTSTTQIIPTGVAPTGRVKVGLAEYNLQSTWTNAATIQIPSAYAGTTFRIIFEWRNTNSAGSQVPTAVDNISMVSVVPAPCIAPAQATSFVSGTKTPTTFPASFSGVGSGYLVIQSTSSTPPSQPLDGTIYSAANIATLGSGLTFIQSGNATIITGTGLTENTQYYYYIYAYNNNICSLGPAYNTSGPLVGTGITCPAIPNSVATAGITSSGFTLNWATPSGGSSGSITYSVQVTTDAGYATNVTGSPFSVSAPTVTLNVTGLSASTTYYYRILANNGCNSAYVTGNVTTALPICVAPANATSFVLGTATSSSLPASFSGTANEYLVIRSLTSTPPSQPVNGTTYSAANIATLGAGLTFVQAGTATTITGTGLASSTQYYYFIYGYNNTACASAPAYAGPLTGTGTTLAGFNNSCINASSLPCGTNNLSGTTVGSTNTAHGTACSMSNYGVWYTFTGDGNTTTISSTATGGFDHEMSISSGSCGTYTNLTCQDSGFSNGTETYTFTTVVGVNYYVYIADYLTGGTTTGTFIISRSCSTPPPPATNNECSGAIALTPATSCSYSYYTNAGATASAGVPAPGCANYLGGDVWFSVVVPANGILHIDTQTGTVTDGGMALYSGACGALSLITCNDDSSSNGAMPFISSSGLTPGQTLYVRFWEYGNDNNGTFGICVTSPEACTTGTGIGTSALGCPTVTSGGLGLNGADPAPVNSCVSSTCVNLEATYLQLGQTTDYTVSSIAYNPPYQFGCLQNPISVNVDDVWSPLITLPFSFCYYGVNYTQCVVGSNGTLSFDTASNVPGAFSAWSFSQNIPSTSLFKNTIFGVYHDIDPSIGGEVGWELITLSSGCRALVASWSNVPMFSNNNILYTGMMVLYENTNIIEVYIKEKNVDNFNVSPWNSGNAIVGLQNADGTVGIAAPGRNALDANWNTASEAWRFTPAGPSITSIKWYEGSGTAGTVVGTTATVNVCPTATTTYTAEVSYLLCNGGRLKQTDETTVTVTGGKTWNGSVSTDWNTANNWTPTGIPNGSDCVIIPVTARNPIISGTGYNGLAGTLSILNNATLTVNSNNSITVTDWVNVQANGTFLIQNDASLVQINDVFNTGNITYKRDTSIRKLDYVYWSSPVVSYNVSSITAPLTPGPIYRWNPTVANPNGGQGNWEGALGAQMEIGRGYIVRGPGTFSDTTLTTLNGSFTGVPNNGTITTAISRGSDTNTAYHAGLNGTEITNFSDNNNLLGNPYPSAIRGSEFLFNNKSKIEGNIKLWTHGALPATISSPFYNTFIYNYSAGDYYTFNFTGTSCCPAANADLFIGAGQGFFVQMKDGAPASDVVTFTNSLRSASYDNSLFFRTTSQFANGITDLERNRIWLDIINSDSLSERTLIGYVENATMGYDSFFDAQTLVAGSMTIYSLIGTEKFSIQGRSLPFDTEDIVPIGVNIPLDGNYKIGINAVDGLFETSGQAIYLEDSLLGIIHDLRQQPYSFIATRGTYNNRFALRYGNGTLGVNNPNAASNLSAFIKDNMLFADATQNIESIQIYDVSGKLVNTYVAKEKNNRFSSNFNFANGVYFAKIKLENGMQFTRKLMN